MIELSKKVPIIMLSGLSKRYLVPGWRMGWIVLCGEEGVFDEVKKGLNNLCSMLGHPNTVVMNVIPEIQKAN
jgi:tyrosine aminotransferase